MSKDTAVNESDNKGRLNNKRNILLLGIAVIIIILGCGLNYFTSKCLYNGKIAQNVFIEDVEVSNLTKKEAFDIVNAKYHADELNLTYKDKEYTISPEDVDLSYDTKQTVDKAYNLTRTNSYFKDIMNYINAKFKGEDFNIKSSYDEEKLDKKINEIAEAINSEPVDAKLLVSPNIHVEPSQVGLKCDVEKNKELIKKSYKDKSYKVITLKIDETEPEVKTEDLQDIDTALASFSTRFDSSDYNRSYNIQLALSRCNTVVMPGETFSYNGQTGKRSLKNGFKEAGVILNGEYTTGLGGGVCQGSTTIFNAVLLSGLEITELQNHSRTSHYASRGRDAMVNDSGGDFKFTNNFDHPVYVYAYASRGVARVAIYGSSKDKVSVDIATSHFISYGYPAATTYRTVVKDGKAKRELIYTAVYLS